MLLNTLENHASMFTFSEIYHISLNIIKDYENIQIKVFETRAVRSWFCFLSEPARSRWLEDVMNAADLVDEKEALCDEFLHSTTYKETLKIYFSEDYEDALDRYKFKQRKEQERKEKELERQRQEQERKRQEQIRLQEELKQKEKERR